MGSTSGGIARSRSVGDGNAPLLPTSPLGHGHERSRYRILDDGQLTELRVQIIDRLVRGLEDLRPTAPLEDVRNPVESGSLPLMDHRWMRC